MVLCSLKWIWYQLRNFWAVPRHVHLFPLKLDELLVSFHILNGSAKCAAVGLFFSYIVVWRRDSCAIQLQSLWLNPKECLVFVSVFWCFQLYRWPAVQLALIQLLYSAKNDRAWPLWSGDAEFIPLNLEHHSRLLLSVPTQDLLMPEVVCPNDVPFSNDMPAYAPPTIPCTWAEFSSSL